MVQSGHRRRLAPVWVGLIIDHFVPVGDAFFLAFRGYCSIGDRYEGHVVTPSSAAIVRYGPTILNPNCSHVGSRSKSCTATPTTTMQTAGSTADNTVRDSLLKGWGRSQVASYTFHASEFTWHAALRTYFEIHLSVFALLSSSVFRSNAEPSSLFPAALGRPRWPLFCLGKVLIEEIKHETAATAVDDLGQIHRVRPAFQAIEAIWHADRPKCFGQQVGLGNRYDIIDRAVQDQRGWVVFCNMRDG